MASHSTWAFTVSCDAGFVGTIKRRETETSAAICVVGYLLWCAANYRTAGRFRLLQGGNELASLTITSRPSLG